MKIQKKVLEKLIKEEIEKFMEEKSYLLNENLSKEKVRQILTEHGINR